MKQPSGPLSPHLLAKLACPKCRGGLILRAKEELLECSVCGLGYPIRRGIPVLLVDEAITIQQG